MLRQENGGGKRFRGLCCILPFAIWESIHCERLTFLISSSPFPVRQLHMFRRLRRRIARSRRSSSSSAKLLNTIERRNLGPHRRAVRREYGLRLGCRVARQFPFFYGTIGPVDLVTVHQ